MVKQVWWEIVVNDPQCLSGKSCASFFQRVLGLYHPSPQCVAVGELYGAFAGELEEQSLYNLDIDFYNELSKIVQVEWADFYFLDRREFVIDEESLATSISRSIFTIRCVDNWQWHVYVPSASIKDKIVALSPEAAIDFGFLEDFSYAL